MGYFGRDYEITDDFYGEFMGWLCHYSGAIYLGIASDCVDIAINEFIFFILLVFDVMCGIIGSEKDSQTVFFSNLAFNAFIVFK